MRTLALAALVTLAGAGPGWAGSSSEYMEKMRADLTREPGSYVGCVPGACLRTGMRRPSTVEIERVPIYDVDTACKRNSVCIEDEQSAYNQLQSEWRDLSTIDREVCIASIGGLVGDGERWTSYRRMALCAAARLQALFVISSGTNKAFQP